MADGQGPGPAGGRRRGRPGYDRESLLAISVAVFNARGYDGTSMEDLSRRATGAFRAVIAGVAFPGRFDEAAPNWHYGE